jgi:hypothetical protein
MPKPDKLRIRLVESVTCWGTQSTDDASGASLTPTRPTSPTKSAYPNALRKLTTQAERILVLSCHIHEISVQEAATLICSNLGSDEQPISSASRLYNTFELFLPPSSTRGGVWLDPAR